MLRPLSIHLRSLVIVIGLALALTVLFLNTDRAFMMSAPSAPPAPLLAGVTVNTTVDEDNTGANCSLREAIIAANTDAAFGGCTAGSGEDIITFTVTGTITLNSALPSLTSSMQLNGPGANQLTVSGNNSVRVFDVSVVSLGAVTFSGLTISNGKADNNNGGAGIRNLSTGTINVTNSTISGNSSPGGGLGGGIDNRASGTLNVTNSTISGNSARLGGGISNGAGTINLSNSTLSGNSSAFGGGGIYNDSEVGTINVTNSTISGNSTSGAPYGGGGICNVDVGPVRLRNSIVALNTAPAGPDLVGPMTSQGHNLIGTNSGSTGFTPGINNANGDLVGTNAAPLNPLLGSLANNGGSTQTCALLPGSPGIDAGDNCVLTNTCSPLVGISLTTDQRGAGFNRSADGNGDGTSIVDIGAYEAPQPLVVTNTNDSGVGTLRQAITSANVDAGPDTINFQAGLTGTITLATALPELSTSMSINGPGANVLTVQRSTAPGTPLFLIFGTFNQNVVLSISGLTISNGDNSQNGGAIRNFGTLTLTGLVFSNNHTAAGGSAILNASTGTITLTNSTISGNRADILAAIYNQGGPFSITNSTFTGNTNLGSAPGTAIFSESNSVTNVTNCTISQNIGQSVAIFQNSGGTGQVNLKNSIVAANSGGNTSGVTDLGNNLIGGTPLLAPLGNYGGPTQTMALLPGSPAINAVTSTGAPATDQRGASRVGAVDIGAFESRGFTIAATSGTPQSATIKTAFASALVASVSSGFSEPVTGGVVTFVAPASGASGTFTGNVATVNVTISAGGGATAPTFTANATAGGAYNVTAGGNGFTSSAIFSLTNNKAATTTVVTSSANPSEFGSNVIFTTTVTSAAGTPTGVVLFKDNGNNLGSAALNSSGVANQPAPSLTAGTHVITVDYLGDTNFASSTGTLSGGQLVKSQLSINDVSTTEGDVGTKSLNFTVTLAAASNLAINVNFATANGAATAPVDYMSINPTTLTFAPGETSRTISVTINGDLAFEPDETFFVNLSGATNATLTDNQGLGTILNDDSVGGVIKFSAPSYSVAEGAGFRTITVERTGETAQPVTVNYASSDHSNPADFIPCTSPGPGFASSRCDFTTAVGTLRFAAGETSKTFNVLISQDNYIEGQESLSLTLSSPTGGAVFGVPSTATLSITDDITEPAANPIDTSGEFVRSHYHDFLAREPDGPGLAFWTDNLEKCNDPARRPAGQTVADCIDKQRESTAVAFFSSPEFQMTGGFVYRLYKGSLIGPPNYDGGSPGRFPTSLEFMRDVSTVSDGIVVNNQISGAVVEANRNRLAAEFAQRPEFTAKYGGLNNTLYVQELFNTTTITPTAAEKQALVDGLNNQTETKASVLRKIVDGTVVVSEGNVQFTTSYGQAFYNQEFRRVFVYMEYIGYLRRNPDSAGFIHWLGKLNFFNGDPFQAEMVRSFILSPEYRSRFGQP
jgi:CSLREA domain-containing protein